MTLPVSHLSHSQVGCMRDCLRLLEYRYVKRAKRRVNPLSMALGRIVHATAAQDYTCRATKGIYLPDEAIQDLASKAFGEETQGRAKDEEKQEQAPVRWENEEMGPGEALDNAISMSRAHHRDIAPLVRPVSPAHIEHRMSAKVRGLPVDILGIADVIAVAAEGRTIRDTKTSKKAPAGSSKGRIRPDDRNISQLATYRIIAAANGEPAVESWLDFVWPTKGGQSEPFRAEITQRDVQLVLEDYAALVRCYETGLFPRTGRGTWICKPGKCDYYEECILGVSRVQDL